MQSKKSSLFESLLNVIIGYAVGVLSQILILPLFGVHISLQANLLLGVYFSIISIARSYLVRRWFNYLHIRDKNE